jgi:LasA protease
MFMVLLTPELAINTRPPLSRRHKLIKRLRTFIFILVFWCVSCSPQSYAPLPTLQNPSSTTPTPLQLSTLSYTPRPAYQPGQLVDYIAQTGDTLPALADHFNTTTSEIREANPSIPDNVTTLPPGFPMQIPIYYRSLWGNPFQIIPDSLFVNGPAQVGFNTVDFVQSQPGWFKNYRVYAGDQMLVGGEVVDHVAENFSVSPRLLLAIIEFHTEGLSHITIPLNIDQYPLGLQDRDHAGLYMQLVLVANELNNAYYGWRTGALTSFDHQDGRLESPDPWQNAATVALQYHFARTLSSVDYDSAINSEGFTKTYTDLFGDPWANVQILIPGSLQQPEFYFPFAPGKSWAFTGGPHTGWGDGLPYAALDFAPPSMVTGCTPTDEWATAMAGGQVVRSGSAVVVLDLDGDGDERTGWDIFYLHLSPYGIAPLGSILKAGDPVGHPSCEGGEATGTHVHIARKYNGEWVPAGGPLAFNLEGWIADYGYAAYQGTLTHYSSVVRACVCSDIDSQVQAALKP